MELQQCFVFFLFQEHTLLLQMAKAFVVYVIGIEYLCDRNIKGCL